MVAKIKTGKADHSALLKAGEEHTPTPPTVAEDKRLLVSDFAGVVKAARTAGGRQWTFHAPKEVEDWLERHSAGKAGFNDRILALVMLGIEAANKENQMIDLDQLKKRIFS